MKWDYGHTSSAEEEDTPESRNELGQMNRESSTTIATRVSAHGLEIWWKERMVHGG
jgi:hypothetical protein